MTTQAHPANEEALIFLDTVDAAFRGLRGSAVLDIFERPGKVEVVEFAPEQKRLEVRITLA